MAAKGGQTARYSRVRALTAFCPFFAPQLAFWPARGQAGCSARYARGYQQQPALTARVGCPSPACGLADQSTQPCHPLRDGQSLFGCPARRGRLFLFTAPLRRFPPYRYPPFAYPLLMYQASERGENSIGGLRRQFTQPFCRQFYTAIGWPKRPFSHDSCARLPNRVSSPFQGCGVRRWRTYAGSRWGASGHPSSLPLNTPLPTRDSTARLSLVDVS